MPDSLGVIHQCSNNTTKLTSYQRDELENKSINLLLEDSFVVAHDAALRNFVGGDEFKLARKNNADTNQNEDASLKHVPFVFIKS